MCTKPQANWFQKWCMTLINIHQYPIILLDVHQYCSVLLTSTKLYSPMLLNTTEFWSCLWKTCEYLWIFMKIVQYSWILPIPIKCASHVSYYVIRMGKHNCFGRSMRINLARVLFKLTRRPRPLSYSCSPPAIRESWRRTSGNSAVAPCHKWSAPL